MGACSAQTHFSKKPFAILVRRRMAACARHSPQRLESRQIVIGSYVIGFPVT
jgi:hypothetical protein